MNVPFIQVAPLWMKRESYSHGIIGLHEEIQDFYEVMSPTFQENKIRWEVVRLIEKIVLSLWPAAKVEVFGSFKTGLVLPTSDIDLVVIGKWDKLPLHTLRRALITSGIHFDDVQLVPSAKVPLVRVIHAGTKIKVDICFNACSGLESANLIMDYMKKYPSMPKLILVLKQFLVCRCLNEVFHGGMSSYCLTLLVISLLQGNHKPKSMKTTNLGNLLLEFVELYGKNFNYSNICISVNNGGYYIPKPDDGNCLLSVLDPLNSGNDIARGSFLLYRIKDAFENAYNSLHKALTETKKSSPASFLQLILDVDSQVLEQRQSIIINFETIFNTLLDFHHNKVQRIFEASAISIPSPKEVTKIPRMKEGNSLKRKKKSKSKKKVKLLEKYVKAANGVAISQIASK